jgi:hypothetical protein
MAGRLYYPAEKDKHNGFGSDQDGFYDRILRLHPRLL